MPAAANPYSARGHVTGLCAGAADRCEAEPCDMALARRDRDCGPRVNRPHRELLIPHAYAYRAHRTTLIRR